MPNPEARGHFLFSERLHKMNTRIRQIHAGRATTKPKAMVSLSQNDFEKHVQEHLDETTIARITKCRTLRGKQFIFRCLIMPTFSWGLGLYLEKWRPNPPYFIHLPWSYVVAQNRLVKEMVFKKEAVLEESEPRAVALQFGEERYDDWLGRFDAWRHAVDRSFWFYLERKGGVPSYRKDLKEAARLGAIHHLWGGLPAPMFGRLAVEMRLQSKESEIFHNQAAQPARVKWIDPELDLWLMEIWPLVIGYYWGYRELWRVAKEKFRTQRVK